MLKMLRHKNVAKMVLWGLLILILPAFVLWGTGNIGGGKDKGPKFVGTIDNRKISFEDFYSSIVAIRAQVILNYFAQPQMIDLFLKNKRFLGKLAWDRLIMSMEAKKRRLSATDAEVINYIRACPIFLRTGRFDDRIYGYVLKNNMGLDPRSFEEMIRQNLAIQKLNDILTKDVKATDADARDLYKRDNAKFKIAYVLFTTGDFSGGIKLGEDEIKDYYELHKDEFITPAKDEKTGEETIKNLSFDEAKNNIISILTEGRARGLALVAANAARKKIIETMNNDKLAFESASGKFGLKAAESVSFGKADYIEGLGEAAPLATAASKLKADEVSSPVDTRKGPVIFRVAETSAIDEVGFEKDKLEWAKKALEDKKNLVLEDWLRGLESQTKVLIDFGDYDKYFR